MTLMAGQTSVSFQVTLVNDDIFEQSETVNFTIISDLPDRVSVENNCVLEVSINNDDSKCILYTGTQDMGGGNC